MWELQASLAWAKKCFQTASRSCVCRFDISPGRTHKKFLHLMNLPLLKRGSWTLKEEGTGHVTGQLKVSWWASAAQNRNVHMAEPKAGSLVRAADGHNSCFHRRLCNCESRRVKLIREKQKVPPSLRRSQPQMSHMYMSDPRALKAHSWKRCWCALDEKPGYMWVDLHVCLYWSCM